MVNRVIMFLLAIVLGISMLFSCQSELSIQTMQYATNGQAIYTKHCQNCHGGNGEGLGKLYPPLNDTIYLNANREKLACIVKNGVTGEMTINGVTYNEKMPGVPSLTSIDIAYVLTYVTTTFGDSKTHFTKEQIEDYLQRCY